MAFNRKRKIIDPITVNKSDEFFIAVAMEEKTFHSSVMLGVIQNGKPTLLARVGKSCRNYSKHRCIVALKATFGSVAARLETETLYLTGNISYAAYAITYAQYLQFTRLASLDIERKAFSCYLPPICSEDNNSTTAVLTYETLEGPWQDPSTSAEEKNRLEKTHTLSLTNSCRHTAIDLVEYTQEIDKLTDNVSRNCLRELPLKIKCAEECNLSLMSLNTNEELSEIIPKSSLEKAEKEKTPILIRRNNAFFIYGDKDNNGRWQLTEINRFQQRLDLIDLPFDKKVIIYNNSPLFTAALRYTLKKGHTCPEDSDGSPQNHFYVFPLPPNAYKCDQKKTALLVKMYKRMEALLRKDPDGENTIAKFNALKELYLAQAGLLKNNHITEALKHIQAWKTSNHAIISQLRAQSFFGKIFTRQASTVTMANELEKALEKVALVAGR